MRVLDGLQKSIPAALSYFVLHRLGDKPASVPFELVDFLNKLRRQRNGDALHGTHRHSVAGWKDAGWMLDVKTRPLCREMGHLTSRIPAMRSTLVIAAAVAVFFGAPVLIFAFGSQSWRDPSPHQVSRVTVDSSVQLEVLDWGGSGPPIVLLGCYMTAHMYDEFAPKLANQFHVIGITRRGIGASDKPTIGYTVQRSVNDVLEVLNSLKLQRSVLIGHSCAGQILTMFAAQYSDRLHGLVYLDGAGDPTMTAADVGASMPDPAILPRPMKPPPAPDYSSFDALRVSQRSTRGWAFPEAELRQQYVANPDGSIGRSQLSPVIRRAITMDARVKPDYSSIRVPVLALYQRERPFEEVVANYAISNEQERAALRQEYEATRALYLRWQHDLLASIPTANIVELTASLYMFLSNEADVLREIRGFAATLTGR